MNKLKPFKGDNGGEIDPARRRFGDRLPPEWPALLAIACDPRYMTEPDRPESKAVNANWLKCAARDFDLALEVVAFFRKQVAEYNPAPFTHSSVVRAFLLQNRLLEFERVDGKTVRRKGEQPQVRRVLGIRPGKARRRYDDAKANGKIVRAWNLTAAEIAEVIRSEQGVSVSKLIINSVRQCMSRGAS